MEGESMLMAVVAAEVLVHNGTNWIHLDYMNGTQNGSGLSTIQLIKVKQEFRIVAHRRADNKRIIDQGIFNRLKYKEATPSFHQWRNEQKQVIGLSFPNEHDAKNFYLAVKHALDNVINIQHITSTEKSQVDAVTYQSPQNFPNYVLHNDIYSNHENTDAQKINGGYIDQRNNCMCLPSALPNQQQNLIRRASQGSNISSSTGGSLPGAIYGQANVSLVISSQANYSPHEAANSVYATSCIPQSERNHSNVNNDQTIENTTTRCSNAPPPPPPPPPDLKNFLSATKQPSFADQLRHVQLRKNSAATTATTSNLNKTLKSSQSAATNSSMESSAHLNGAASCGKLQNGSQDLISELADRLNKRKMNSESGNTNSTQTKSSAHQNAIDVSKKNISSETAHKIPSVSSLPGQDDTNGNTSNHLASTANLDQQNGSKYKRGITSADIEHLKAELKETLTEELNKLKVEIAQTIRNEIAKIINQK